MSFWTALVAIVALLVFARMRADRQRYEGRGDGFADAPPTPEVERELAALRQRVEVLERIITDDRGRDRLAREIESLRDDASHRE